MRLFRHWCALQGAKLFLILLAGCTFAGCSGPSGGHDGLGDDHDSGTSTSPYTGQDAAYLTVNADFPAELVDCRPVLYDGTSVISVSESCGEPIAVAPGSQLKVSVGNTDVVCVTCFAEGDFGDIWTDLPLQNLADGGQAIGEPISITLAAGDDTTVSVKLNQYVSGEWTCVDPDNPDNVDSGTVEFEGFNTLQLPGYTDLTVLGRDVIYDDGTLVQNGTFDDSFHISVTSTGGMAGDRVEDCWAE